MSGVRGHPVRYLVKTRSRYTRYIAAMSGERRVTGWRRWVTQVRRENLADAKIDADRLKTMFPDVAIFYRGRKVHHD